MRRRRRSHDSFATLHGLYWFVAGLCNTAPTLLAVDDAHWDDLPSLRFLAYLARRLDGLKLALLVTARPEPVERQELLRLLAAEPQAVQVRPHPWDALRCTRWSRRYSGWQRIGSSMPARM
jgi:hypothetical protein